MGNPTPSDQDKARLVKLLVACIRHTLKECRRKKADIETRRAPDEPALPYYSGADYDAAIVQALEIQLETARIVARIISPGDSTPVPREDFSDAATRQFNPYRLAMADAVGRLNARETVELELLAKDHRLLVQSSVLEMYLERCTYRASDGTLTPAFRIVKHRLSFEPARVEFAKEALRLIASVAV
jgi:hypothetical protein